MASSLGCPSIAQFYVFATEEYLFIDNLITKMANLDAQQLNLLTAELNKVKKSDLIEFILTGRGDSLHQLQEVNKISVVTNLESRLEGMRTTPNLTTPRISGGQWEGMDQYLERTNKLIDQMESIIMLLNEKCGRENREALLNVPKAVMANVGKTRKASDVTVTKLQTNQGIVKDNKDQKDLRKSNIITGTSKSGSNCFRAADKRAWFYVGKTSKSTTCDLVTQHLKEKFPSADITVEELQSRDGIDKSNFKTKSFKVGIDFELLNEVASPDTWPENIVVKRFRFFRDQHGVKSNM